MPLSRSTLNIFVYILTHEQNNLYRHLLFLKKRIICICNELNILAAIDT